MSFQNTEIAKKCARRILDSKVLLYIIGNGINVDIGVPDIRSNQDFWKEYPKFETMSLTRSKLLSHDLNQMNPEVFWYYFGKEYMRYKKLTPNPCYFKMLQIAESLKRDNYFVMTTNYDEHVLEEGFPEERVFEAHGNINYFQC